MNIVKTDIKASLLKYFGFDSFKGEIVSVISFESNNKVTSTNLEYPLDSYKLSPSPRAIRNQSLGDNFTIESSEKLMVFQIKD